MSTLALEALEFDISVALSEMAEYLPYWRAAPMDDPEEEDVRNGYCKEYMRVNIQWRDLRSRRRQILDVEFAAHAHMVLRKTDDMAARESLQNLADSTEGGAVWERTRAFLAIRRFSDAHETMAALRKFFAGLAA